MVLWFSVRGYLDRKLRGIKTLGKVGTLGTLPRAKAVMTGYMAIFRSITTRSWLSSPVDGKNMPCCNE